MNRVVTDLKDVNSYADKYEYISFDLFDTLIYRSTLSLSEIGELSSVYACGLLYRELGTDHAPLLIRGLRKKLTYQLKRSLQADTFEPELSQVLKSVFTSLGVCDELAFKMATSVNDFELAVELDSLKVVSGGIAVLKALREKKKKIIIISDMYFSEADIKKILTKTGISKYVDDLFVSSKYGCTKRSGALYSVAINALELKPSQIIHIGDNFSSDVASAKKIGIDSKLFKIPKTERALVNRLKEKQNLPNMVSGLVLAFVYYVAISSSRYGLKRIYFLSRDATAIGRAFEQARQSDSTFNQLTGNLEVKFLSISRASIVFLELKSGCDPLKQVLKLYLGITPKGYELPELFDFVGLKYGHEQKLSFKINTSLDIEAASFFIKNNFPMLADELIYLAKVHANNAIEYLRQESVLGVKGPIGFVDIGYKGSIARALASWVFREASNNEASHFHLYLMLMCSGNSRPDSFDQDYPLVTVLPSLIKQNHLSQIQKLNFSWFEIFFQAMTEGPLSGYSFKDSQWHSNFAEPNKIHSSESCYIDECIADFNNIDTKELFLCESFREGIAKRFVKMMASPNQLMVKEIGGLMYFKGALDSSSSSIIDKRISSLRLFNPKYVKKITQDEVWIEGSLTETNMTWLKVPLSMLLFLYNCSIFKIDPKLFVKFKRVADQYLIKLR